MEKFTDKKTGLSFRIEACPETGITIFSGLNGCEAPDGFKAVYDECKKNLDVTGRLSLKEFAALAETLTSAESLFEEWMDSGGEDGGEGGSCSDGIGGIGINGGSVGWDAWEHIGEDVRDIPFVHGEGTIPRDRAFAGVFDGVKS